MVVRHDQRALGSALTNGVPRQIRHQLTAGVWAQMPVLANTAKNKLTAAVADLCLWARLCFDCGIPFMLFGPSGAMKRDPQVEIAVSKARWTEPDGQPDAAGA